jgi:lipopolysaccharide/colanic/teichoic acid biosynthesis glycosyltransferase
LERERAEQPELRYGDATEAIRAILRTRRITTSVVFIALLLGFLAFVPAIVALFQSKSPAGEAIASVLAALIGAAFSFTIRSTSLVPERSLPSNTPRKRRRVALAFKRIIDVAFSAFSLIALAPLVVMIVVALILEDSKAPVLFSQTRIGRGGTSFRMLKFRTVYIATDRTPRIGPIGRLLRASALDELPQLVNVLKGEMSLVGPRPIRPMEPIQTAWWISHSFRPGLTGLAQIRGIDLSIQDREELDMLYEDNWSPLVDTKIVLRTLTGFFKA